MHVVAIFLWPAFRAAAGMPCCSMPAGGVAYRFCVPASTAHTAAGRLLCGSVLVVAAAVRMADGCSWLSTDVKHALWMGKQIFGTPPQVVAVYAGIKSDERVKFCT